MSRAQILADLIHAGWRPPPMTTEQADRLLDDMRDLSHGQTLGLTMREVDALERASVGEGRKDIAKAWGKSPETAKQALELAKQKLGATNITHAVALALAQGLIDGP